MARAIGRAMARAIGRAMARAIARATGAAARGVSRVAMPLLAVAMLVSFVVAAVVRISTARRAEMAVAVPLLAVVVALLALQRQTLLPGQRDSWKVVGDLLAGDARGAFANTPKSLGCVAPIVG